MDFKEATDLLLAHIEHAELADALGVSVASIRQARLPPKAKAYRQPPKRWREDVIRLAERQSAHYKSLADNLKADEEAEANRRLRQRKRPL